MNHSELLEELDELIKEFDLKYDNNNPYYKALRAVVELHKPDYHQEDGFVGLFCHACEVDYPCETTEAIEKELK